MGWPFLFEITIRSGSIYGRASFSSGLHITLYDRGAFQGVLQFGAMGMERSEVLLFGLSRLRTPYGNRKPDCLPGMGGKHRDNPMQRTLCR